MICLELQYRDISLYILYKAYREAGEPYTGISTSLNSEEFDSAAMCGATMTPSGHLL